MALPTLERAYEFSVNWKHYATGNASTDAKQVGLHFVQQMCAWSSNPWTVVASSDASTAGWPGPGWQTTSDMVSYAPGNPHSWIVLESVGGQQICIDLSNQYSQYLADIYFSPDGTFTGGDINNAPLSGANYRTLSSASCWGTSGSNSYTCRIHMIHATNGEFDAMFMTLDSGESVTGCFVFTKVLDPTAQFTLPWVAFWPSAWTGHSPDPKPVYDDSTHGWGWASAWKGFRAAGGVDEINACVVNEGLNNLNVPARFWKVNTISGKAPMFPLILVGNDVTSYGVQGRIPDVFSVSKNTVTGATMEEDPLNPTCKWAVFGDYAFPWPGTNPRIN